MQVLPDKIGGFDISSKYKVVYALTFRARNHHRGFFLGFLARSCGWVITERTQRTKQITVAAYEAVFAIFLSQEIH